MGKRKGILLTLCLMMTLASAVAIAACDIEQSSNSSPDSSVVTPIDVDYKIKFETLGGTNVDWQSVKKGEKVVKPTNPTLEGYVFVEWLWNGNPYDFETPVTRDMTLKANWALEEKATFVVTFEAEGETFREANVVDGRKVIEPAAVPTKEAYLFDGWLKDGVAYDFETPITENITLTANWAKAWTVTFNTLGGTEIASQTLKVGTAAEVPTEETTRRGYYFVEWQKDGERYDFATPITEDIELTADWGAYGLLDDQIGIRIYGKDFSGDKEYLNVTKGDNGETIIEAKFTADATYAPALILKNIFDIAYYQERTTEGEPKLTFNLKVGGDNAADVDDLYVFGKALSTFPQKNGVYNVYVDFGHIANHYKTISTIATSGGQAGQASSMPAKILTWKSPAGDWETTRKYVFTISGIELKAAPTLAVEFAQDSKDFIEIGKTTALTAESSAMEYLVWSSSNPNVATVENGVVTGKKGGMATITANCYGVTVEKSVYVLGNGLYSDQIGVHAYGWDQTTNSEYFNMATGSNGEMVVTAKIQAGGNKHYGALTLLNLEDKAYYEKLLANGYTKLTFTLSVGGDNAADVSDLYVFGTNLTAFAKNANGAYEVVVDLQYLVDNFAKTSKMGTSVEAKIGELNYMFLAWKTDVWTARNYVFTFSNVGLSSTQPLYGHQFGVVVNGWNQSTLITATENANKDIVLNVVLQDTTGAYSAVVFRNLESKAYYQGLIADGYKKLTFKLAISGTDADKISGLWVFGTQLTTLAQDTNGAYIIEIDLQYIVDNYDGLSTAGLSVSAGKNTQYMLIAWKGVSNSWSKRKYTFTISEASFIK